MSLKQHTFESVANSIRASYGDSYESIDVEQSNEQVNPNKDGSVGFTDAEKDKMFAENYELIYFVANKYVVRGGIEREELYHSGLLGMVKALNTYDKNLGKAKFSTYAIRCITNEILYFMRRERKHREDHEGNYLHHLEDTLRTDESGQTFEKGDTIEDENSVDVDEVIYQEQINEALMNLLNRALTKNEQYIIIKRHGLDGSPTEMTQREIAEILDMSQANVSKLQKTAEEKLYTYLTGITRNPNLTMEEAMERLGGLNRGRKDALSNLRKKQRERSI